MSLVVHQDTLHQLDAVMQHTPHALLLTGPYGIGLAALSQYIADSYGGPILRVLPEKNEQVDVDKGTITVESIRRLYDNTRTISTSGRTVIIDYAERMAAPAQNAFLKLLEEPAEGTRFILLTHQPELLLPTITSRSQRIDVRRVTKTQSEELLDTLKVTDPTKRAQLLFIAEGLPAALSTLAQDEAAFTERVEFVKDARSFVTGGAYDRLLLAKKYKDSRPGALLLLEDSLKLLRRGIAEKGDASSLRMLSRFEVLHKRLSEQGNVRLQLSAAIML